MKKAFWITWITGMALAYMPQLIFSSKIIDVTDLISVMLLSSSITLILVINFEDN